MPSAPERTRAGTAGLSVTLLGAVLLGAGRTIRSVTLPDDLRVEVYAITLA
jgi:hypothetical protein